MQIGGGVRVGDAFQVISGVKPIAFWVTEFCVEISPARHASYSVRTREISADLYERSESEAGERGQGLSGRSERRTN